jgi:hypothetical protein
MSAAPSSTSLRPAAPRDVREALPVFLGAASPRILLVALALALAARVAVGGVGWGDAVVLAVIVALWPLQEWAIHVFILHWKPRKVLGWTLDFAVPRKHRAHHRDPADLSLVFIPLHSYLFSLPLVVALYVLVTPSTSLALTGISAHVALALHYEWVHFLVHTRWRPRWRPYRALWQHHRLHHFRNEHYWFGVTRRGGDWLLRTRPAADAVPTSPTCLTLGLDATGTTAAAGSEG